jgi:hypothetical protein
MRKPSRYARNVSHTVLEIKRYRCHTTPKRNAEAPFAHLCRTCRTAAKLVFCLQSVTSGVCFTKSQQKPSRYAQNENTFDVGRSSRALAAPRGATSDAHQSHSREATRNNTPCEMVLAELVPPPQYPRTPGDAMPRGPHARNERSD